MTSCEDSAEWKFWRTPELVDKLLTFLDAGSTKLLAESHDLTLQILGQAFNWDKLTKRTFPVGEDFDLVEDADTFLASEKSKTGFLVDILRMIKGAQQPQLKKDLLHAICKRFPGEPAVEKIWKQKPFIDVSCSSCLETHQVSSWGFLLLVHLEAKLGSEEMNVLRVAAGDLKEPLLSSLTQKVLRQEEKVEEVKVAQVCLNSKESAEAWATLVEKSQETIGIVWAGLDIDVKEDIGAEGWAAIRRAVVDLLPPQLRRCAVHNCTIVSEMDATGSGKKEDMMAIWEVITNWSVKNRNGRFWDFDSWAWQVKGWKYH